MPPGYDDSNYYCCNINPLDGKLFCGIYVCFALRIMHAIAINWATMAFPVLMLCLDNIY